jgi:MFS family permease
VWKRLTCCLCSLLDWCAWVRCGVLPGEYVSRAKARAASSMTILCGLPFHGCMLLCIMFLTFGSYWCYDIPGSIETQLTNWFNNDQFDKDGHSVGSYTHGSNSLLYSIYSWPNCILAFIGGFLLDKVTGVRKGAMLFCGLVALGQLIFALGCQWKLFWLTVVGRFVFGLGGENLTVAQNTYTVRWFDGKQLALAFGLVVAFSRIGTSINFVVSPKLANSNDGVPLTLWFGMGMCALSFIACCLASYSDWWGETKVEAQRQIYMSTLSAEEAVYVLKLDAIAEPPTELEKSGLKASVIFLMNEMRMLGRIPLTAWLLFVITAVFYVAILNFYQVASDMMQNTGDYISDDLAGLYMVREMQNLQSFLQATVH